jgi:hypothetical protein
MRAPAPGRATLLAIALLTAPLAAEAQPTPKPARIALVCGARCEGGGYDATAAW